MRFLLAVTLIVVLSAPVLACEGFEQDMAALENIVRSTPPRIQQPAVAATPVSNGYTVCEKDNCLEIHKPLAMPGTYASPPAESPQG